MWEMGIPFFADLPWVTTRFVHILLYHFLRIEFHIPNLPNCRKFLSIFAVQMHEGLIVNLRIKIKSGEYLESDNTQNAWQVNLQLGAYGPFSIMCNILYYEMCRVTDSFTKSKFDNYASTTVDYTDRFSNVKNVHSLCQQRCIFFKIKWQKTWQAFGKNVEAFVKTTFSFYAKRKTKFIIP